MCVYVNPVLDEVEISFLCAVFINHALHAEGATLSSHGTKPYCLSPTSERGRQITSPHTKVMCNGGNTSPAWFQACLWAASATREHKGGSLAIKAMTSVVFVLVLSGRPHWFILDPWLIKKQLFQLKATQMDPITQYSGHFRGYHQCKFF